MIAPAHTSPYKSDENPCDIGPEVLGDFIEGIIQKGLPCFTSDFSENADEEPDTGEGKWDEGVARATINVYLHTGVTKHYEVTADSPDQLHEKIHEHHEAIITGGYRSMANYTLVSWPVHMIKKVTTSHYVLSADFPGAAKRT